MALGRKTGGRTKGTVNKTTKERQEMLSAAGMLPLDYMLKVMRNPKTPPPRRDWAAGAAAPYIHPKLAQVEHANKDGKPFVVQLATPDRGVL